MKAAGGDSDDLVPYVYAGAVYQIVLVHYANGKPCYVVFSFIVKRRHLSRLTSNEGASCILASLRYPLDHLGGLFGVKLTCGKIVEEEERLRPLDYYVIDTHGNQVYAYCVMPVRHEGDFQLCTDTVCG